ncbi:MAG: hypothetical protein WBO12_08885, partial [Xanthobacteraceae bacterium]
MREVRAAIGTTGGPNGDRGVDLTSFLTARNRVSGLLHVGLGSIATEIRCLRHVRFAPHNDRKTADAALSRSILVSGFMHERFGVMSQSNTLDAAPAEADIEI